MDLGVDSAGFTTACAIETDAHCVNTLKRNSSRKKLIWNVDVRALPPERVLSALGLKRGDVRLLHGGPPCQPFSQIGKRGGTKDPRGMLVFEMVRFADALRPTAVLIEQVPYFLKAEMPNGMSVVEALADDFRDLGYELFCQVMDASHYGLPQHRKRAIIVCVPKTEWFTFPLGNGKRCTVGQAFQGLPPAVRRGENPLAPNHIDVTPARDRERISYVPEGLWLSKSPNVPPDIMRRLTRKDTTKFRRLDRAGLSPTLRCGEAPYHPTEDRYVTPREAARIQGFPDNHIFTGPIRRRSGNVRDLDQHRQIANAVPPLLAAAVASKIADTLCLS